MEAYRIQTNRDLAKTIGRLTDRIDLDAVVCLTENGELAREISGLDLNIQIIAATANSQTYSDLSELDVESVRMPVHDIDKYRQIRHMLSVALKSGSLSVKDFVLAALARDVYPSEGNLIVLAEMEPQLKELSVTDLVKLTDGIRPEVLDATIMVATKMGRITLRGKRLGTIFTLGDSHKVLDCSKQLIPNPFRNQENNITDTGIHDALIELAKLDGAFVIRGDGLIQTAGTYLGTPEGVERRVREQLNLSSLPEGLGSRHVSAAAVTAYSEATSVVISKTDGHIRIFAGGQMVLKMDPNVDYGQVEEEQRNEAPG